MQRLSKEGNENLIALLSQGFEIYNAFAPGAEGEEQLLKLRDAIQRQMDAGDDPETPVTFTLPLGLVGYMMASAKHLGDSCTALSQMGKEGTLFD